MINRLGSFLASRPRRAAGVVIVLAIGFILVLAGMLAVVLDLGAAFEPPYPSEDTPLSVVSGGVKYTRNYNMTFVGDYESGLLYSEHKIAWRYDTGGGGGGGPSGPLIDQSDQDELNTGANATVRSQFIMSMSPWYDSPQLNMNLSITDTTGDGVFGFGDYIVFEGAPSTEGIVYTIGLVWLGPGTMYEEWSYAFHDGKFYSWMSSVLPSANPWWSP